MLGLFVAVCLAAESAIGVGKDPTVITYPQLTGSTFDTLVVAKVGDIEITAKEFLLGYEYGPAFVKRQKNSKERFVEFMIYDKLLALEGYSLGMDSSRIVSETLSAIEGDLATEELYRQDVLSQVRVSDEEIAQGVIREKSHISIKWLYAPTFAEIDNLQKELSAGVAFDSLFISQLSDSVDFEDRFMQTSRFRLETGNATLSAIVDTLQYGENSASIGTADGWYIVKIVDLWSNPIITKSEQARLANNVSRALHKRKADALSDQYVKEIMLDHHPVIKRHTFDVLATHIGKSILPPQKFTEWALTKNLMAEYGPIDSVDISEHLDQTLVTLVDSDVSMGEFFAWYRPRESTIRFSAVSQQRFFVSLEKIVWRMVRDKLLVEEAMSKGMQHRESVRTQKQWWQDKVISSAIKSRLAAAIHLDENALASYYERNKNDYRRAGGEPLPFEEVKADVRRDAYALEGNKQLLHCLLELQKKYSVEINRDALNALPMPEEGQSGAVEFYVAKKGGTFPRPVFPTVGYEWKAWD